jgi:SAM-dependent methyltransferase
VAALQDIAARLAEGGKGRTEAEIQADVRSLMLGAPLYLEDEDLEVFLEAQAQGGRIDIEAGCAVIEVKKRIGSPSARGRAIDQLLGYVRTRTEERGQRYVGVLTDGRLWVLYRLRPKDGLAEVSQFRLDSADDVAALVAWLETVLATAEAVEPTEAEIIKRLGSGSPAAQMDLADLREIYEACRSEPEVALKRELWGRLLTSALGTHFPDTDELFVLHTYLVVTAELIAHTVVGLPVQGQEPSALLSGQVFRSARLGGVVDADFFDWPARVEGGQRFVASLSRRLVRFDWSNVQHDIMKALYESIIDPKTRKKLGEYYTPDWLAEGIIEEVVEDPLGQRVLDPACGSGTFLFWAARRYLSAAEDAGVPNDEAIEGLVAHVAGIDLHPVAVALARVTYLLAIGTERLQAERPSFSVPVYLGDSVRWDQDETLFDKGGITIPTGEEPDRGDPELHFPEAVVADANRFDQLIAELAERASSREAGTPLPKIDSILRRYAVRSADQAAVVAAFESLCHLHDEGRNHIWGYYVRNLARPFSFTRPNNQVDVLVGNPPWLSFRFMPVGMQERYRALAQERGLWMGGKVATHQDLADLFVARSAELYLAPKGQFGFVMPAGALSRRAYEGFRSGTFEAPGASTKIAFDQPWDLRAVVPDVFPMPSCVVFGARAAKAGPLPGEAKAFFGEVQARGASWSVASGELVAHETRIERSGDAKALSPYATRFYQGATILPSVLLRVSDLPSGPLGVPKGTRQVASLRSSLEKEPWKDLDSLEGFVETEFVKPVFLGSGVAPFRTLAEIAAVIPWSNGSLMDGSNPSLDEHQGLARWWRAAEDLWEKHKGSGNKLTLGERLNYQRGLSNQLPISRHRVLYTQSGNQIAACRVEGSKALIEHKLYWAAVESAEEAHYLVAILNSNPLHRVVEPLMSEGLFGKRDIDKYVFAAPFPNFDMQNSGHVALAGLGQRAEELAAEVELEGGWGFQKVRRVLREALRKQGIAAEIDAAVAELLAMGLDTAEQKPKKVAPDLMDKLSEAERRADSPQKPKRRARPVPKRPSRSRPRKSSLSDDS